eukprot:scaffold52693_cov19-Tisochrysis_lutea.AAC.7
MPAWSRRARLSNKYVKTTVRVRVRLTAYLSVHAADADGIHFLQQAPGVAAVAALELSKACQLLAGLL